MRAVGATAMLAALAFAPSPARADALSIREDSALASGATVTREQTLERGDRRYVGGVTYTMLDATEDELSSLLDDVTSFRRLLPHTKSAVVVGHKDGDMLVELRQGTSIFETTYTIRVRRDAAHADGSRTVRFWLDPSRPHGIDDAWGFFRVARASGGKLLLTYGALVDMGDGLGRALFEERVRAAMLSVPQRLRQYLAERRADVPRRYSMK